MTIHTYTDGYLAPQVTTAREDKAIAEVDALGTFPTEWRDRLVICRAYVITCIECMRSADDTFSAKLSAYRKDWEALLVQARLAQAAAEAAAGTPQLGGGSFFTVPLERA